MGLILKRAALLAAITLLAACGDDDSTARPTASPTVSASATPTASVTATTSSSATATAAPPSPTRTASATATHTPPPTSTLTVTITPTITPTATATQDPLRLPDLHAEPDAVDGGRIVDAEGREVLLRGVNVNALAEYWQYGSFPTVFPLLDSDADLMAGIGWNVVRLLLSWSRVEPQPGVYDDAYLEQARTAVRLFASRGIYTILDLHQDAWGPTLAARPNEVCIPPSTPAFGWDGAPGWATLDRGQPRCASLGIRELNAAVTTSFSAFFEDRPGPGDVGIRTRYVAMLAHVARILAAERGVAGYDLMNEPNAFSDGQAQQLSDLYAAALPAIRAAETDAGSAPRLVLFEPGALWAIFGMGVPPDFARDRDIVYAPHLYQGGLDAQPLEPAFVTARGNATIYDGAPVLTGEWGSDPRRASDPNDPYFIEHQRLQDVYRIGATLWTWRESCGDPHKAGDVRAGNLPYVWGEFEVDCTTNAVTGLRQDLLDQLTRGYVRAAPGRLVESRWDATGGTLHASGVAPTGGVQLLVFYPARDGADPRVETSGLSDVAYADHLLVARADGGEWSLVVSPAAP